MRRGAAIALSIACLSWASPAWALELPVGTDKVAHFGLSYLATDQLMRAGVPREHAMAGVFVAGWLKEVLDSQVDAGDLAADAAGVLLAGYLRVEWKF